MIRNIEQQVISWLNTSETLSDYPAYAMMPADNPGKFITVELTGTTITRTISEYMLAVRVYASSRFEAAQAAETLVAPRLEDMWQADHIAGVHVDSVYNYPDPGPPVRNSYQMTVTVTTATF